MKRNDFILSLKQGYKEALTALNVIYLVFAVNEN
jgi:hypothetical protein